MKRIFLLLVATSWFALAASAAPDGARATWEQAKSAYDGEDFPAAVERYAELVEQGFHFPQLYFNLGNAYFRSGQLGEAILNYRRVLVAHPRDPDARANLRFALEEAGVEGPARSPAALFFGSISQRTWTILAVSAYWLAALLLAAWLLRRRRSPLLLRCAVAALVVALLSLNGFLHWRGREKEPEVVVLEPDQVVRFAPLRDATVHFSAPEGSLLRLTDTADGWYKVRRGKESGWIPAGVCAKVQ